MALNRNEVSVIEWNLDSDLPNIDCNKIKNLMPDF
jgi:hypothetical protein